MSSDQRTKIAQRRSVLHKLHETLNVPRRLHEALDQNIFGPQMELLKRVDDEIREIALGEGGPSLKELLKSAKRSLKEKKYPDALYYAKQIDQIVAKMVAAAANLTVYRDEQIDDLFGQSDIGYQEVAQAFEKTAGILDMFSGWSRNRTARLIEKMYRNKVRKMRLAVEGAVSGADSLVNNVLRTLKNMGTARASGDVSAYLEGLSNIGKWQEQFSTRVDSVYQEHIGPMVARIQEQQAAPVTTGVPAPTEAAEPEAAEPETAEPEAAEPEKTKEDVKPPPSRPVPSGGVQVPTLPADPSVSPAEAPQEKEDEEEEEEEGEKQQSAIISGPDVYQWMQQHPDYRFGSIYRDIDKALSRGDYGVAGALMAKYSQMLEDAGLIKDSVRVLSVAQELLNE
jgi:HEPN domain-containing protein